MRLREHRGSTCLRLAGFELLRIIAGIIAENIANIAISLEIGPRDIVKVKGVLLNDVVGSVFVLYRGLLEEAHGIKFYCALRARLCEFYHTSYSDA
jgi:hypothetical protein